jgi:hypothetical protein
MTGGITRDRNEVEKASADTRSHALRLFHRYRSGSNKRRSHVAAYPEDRIA